MQGCTAGRQHETSVGGRDGATARRLSRRAARLACVAGPIAVLGLFLVAMLPTMDAGGQLVPSALADERSADKSDGGKSRDADDAQGESGENDHGDDGDDGYDSGDGRSTGDKGGKNGGRGFGKSGGRGGADADAGGEDRDPDDDDRDDVADTHDDGHDPAAGTTPGDLSDGALEDRVAAAGVAPGLAAFRATVLSDDEEAAAIAAGWATAD